MTNALEHQSTSGTKIHVTSLATIALLPDLLHIIFTVNLVINQDVIENIR